MKEKRGKKEDKMEEMRVGGMGSLTWEWAGKRELREWVD